MVGLSRARQARVFATEARVHEPAHSFSALVSAGPWPCSPPRRGLGHSRARACCAWRAGMMAYEPTGRGGVQAQAEDARTAEWARAFDGDDEEEVPLLPAHLEAQWIVLSCEPWNIILNLSAYIGRVVVDMWDFKEKLAVRAVCLALRARP